MHFGMEGISGLLLYLAAIGCFLTAVFSRPIFGLYVLVFLLPLQTVRYRMNQYPLGGSFVGVMLLGVALGLLRQRRSVLSRNAWTSLLVVYALYTFLSLLWGSFYLGTGLPIPGNPRFGVWVEYMFMPGLLLLTAAVQPSLSQIRTILFLMALSTLAVNKSYWDTVSSRDYSSYSDDLRDAGTAGYAGTNGLAAYEAQFATLLLALAAYEKRWLIRAAGYLLAFFSVICLMYSLSRGGYLALLLGVAFVGLLKQRLILVGLILFAFSWETVVPAAVVQRVFMTYDQHGGGLDHSAQTRIELWKDAMQLFNSSPAVGTGFNTYAYMHRIGTYEDTHNYYLKVLVETGVVGLVLFVILLLVTFLQGIRCWLGARDPLIASLGLGLASWTIACALANSFGDRWSFLQVNGYFWVLAGLVAHGQVLTAKQRRSRLAERKKQLNAAPLAETVLC